MTDSEKSAYSVGVAHGGLWGMVIGIIGAILLFAK